MPDSSGPINLQQKFALFHEHWSPKIIGCLNDLHVKVVKVQGEFVWHAHPETDELFFVHKGELIIDYRDRRNIIRAGEFFVVPKGVEHRPWATFECEIVLIEPAGTVNTGDVGGERTVEPAWI